MVYRPKRGAPQLQRRFPGIDPIRRSVPARDFARINDALDLLYGDEQLESLRAFQRGDISVAELLDAARRGHLSDEHLLARLHLARPLWATARIIIAAAGTSERTRGRYQTSFDKLERLGGLGPHAAIRDLARVNWKALRARWPGRGGQLPCSAAEWMHLRRAVSVTLSGHLGDVLHPFRRRVMALIPTMREDERVVELTVAEFWSLVEHAAPQARPGIVTIAATGFRVEEYYACREQHKLSASLAVKLPRGKTGADVQYVAESLWPWVDAGIPAPLGIKWLRIHFQRAARAIGRPELWLRDLRHVYGQLAADAGVSQSDIQAAMRHDVAAMTARYLKRKAKRHVADAVGEALRAPRLKAQ